MKAITLAVFFGFSALTSLANPKRFRSAEDYFIACTNLDSLDKAVHAQQDNSARQLHNLLWLEFSRNNVSDRFGADLDTIKGLCSRYNNPLDKALFHYLQGTYLRETNLASAIRHGLEAVRYFETSRDTTGLLMSYSLMTLLSANSKTYQVNAIKSPEYYYDRIMTLGQQSARKIDTLIKLRTVLIYEKLVKKTQSYSNRIGIIDEILRILNQNPRLEPMRATLYSAMGTFYSRHGQPQQALAFTLKAQDLYLKQTAVPGTIISYNAGIDYLQTKNYTEAESYFNKVIRNTDAEKHAINLLISAHSALIDIYMETKRYDAALASIRQMEELYATRHKRLKGSLFEELRTQYETDQKESENRLLVKKNELAEARSTYYQHLLAISIFALLIVSSLIYLLYRTNVKQKQLMNMRDRFYTVIAHDLREPLSSLANVGSLLRFLIRTNKQDEIKKLTQHLDRMGQQTGLLLNNLLEWGKNNYFDQQSPAQTFDAAPLLLELTNVYATLAEAKGITLAVDVPTNYLLTTNPKDLSLIVRNLIDNALKFTPTGGQVWLRASATSGSVSNATTATIEVVDTGVGIDADQVTYLRQVIEGRIKPQVGTHGLGLGLLLIVDFARKNGMSLAIHGHEGKGTSVSLGVPR